eukprot:SAG22_NODE_444_length_10453_cov_8.586343_13_plen_158_part_00
MITAFKREDRCLTEEEVGEIGLEGWVGGLLGPEARVPMVVQPPDRGQARGGRQRKVEDIDRDGDVQRCAAGIGQCDGHCVQAGGRRRGRRCSQQQRLGRVRSHVKAVHKVKNRVGPPRFVGLYRRAHVAATQTLAAVVDAVPAAAINRQVARAVARA